jgi:hypothetical protein
VTVGGRACRNILQGIGGASPHENIQCNPPAGAGRGKAVVVTVGNQSSTDGTRVDYHGGAVHLLNPVYP